MTVTGTGTEPLFDPVEELPKRQLRRFGEHYGIESFDAIRRRVRRDCYGGSSIEREFEALTLSSSDAQLPKRLADVTIHAASAGTHKDIRIRDLSMKQLVVTGLAHGVTDPWDGDDHWAELDPQYRVELCHSEISRWSLILKQNGKPLPGVSISGDGDFDKVELVNNCTTTEGFELKLTRESGEMLHGSFGRNGELDDVYSRLSQYQAGSLAKQNSKLGFGVFRQHFLGWRFDPLRNSLYFVFDDQDDVTLEEALEWSIPVDLKRYGFEGSVPNTRSLKIDIDRGRIRYSRWGKDSEYYRKPMVRRLMFNIESSGIVSKRPPKTYPDVEQANAVRLANFQVNGLYDLAKPRPKRNYKWLYDLERCEITKKANGLYDLELRRFGDEGRFEFRRIVYGNIDLDGVSATKPLTLHRFGWGARSTTQLYDASWIPAGERTTPIAYSYLLGGKGSPDQAFTYITPEPFGLERTIFSKSPEGGTLYVELVSFERILSVWRCKIRL